MKIYNNTYTIKKKQFLEYLSQTCNVTRSCRLAGVDRSDMYKLRKADPYFAKDWAIAIEMGLDALEDEMNRRAFKGTAVTNKFGTYRKYSDVLAIFLMKAHKPHIYSDRYRMELLAPKKASLRLDNPRVRDKIDGILNAIMTKKSNDPILNQRSS